MKRRKWGTTSGSQALTSAEKNREYKSHIIDSQLQITSSGIGIINPTTWVRDCKSRTAQIASSARNDPEVPVPMSRAISGGRMFIENNS